MTVGAALSLSERYRAALSWWHIAALRLERHQVLALGLLLLLQPAGMFAAEIYQSTDAQGRRVYSDHPLSDDAQRIVVRSSPRNSEAERARVAAELVALERAEAERQKKLAVDNAEKLAREKAEQVLKENCRRARDRYLTFSERGRIYRRDEQGNRVYYSSEEIDAARVLAKQTMETCVNRSDGNQLIFAAAYTSTTNLPEAG